MIVIKVVGLDQNGTKVAPKLTPGVRAPLPAPSFRGSASLLGQALRIANLQAKVGIRHGLALVEWPSGEAFLIKLEPGAGESQVSAVQVEGEQHVAEFRVEWERAHAEAG